METVKVGDRIKVIRSKDKFNPLPSGLEGVVTHVHLWSDGSGQVFADWEGTTRTLGLSIPEDSYAIIERADS